MVQQQQQQKKKNTGKAKPKKFYWLQDRIEQGEFRIFKAPGE